MRRAIGRIHGWASVAVLAAIVVQFFFAGLGAFGATSYNLHETLGYLIFEGSVLLFVLALLGGVGRVRLALSAALPVLVLIQIVLVHTTPVVAALHPVNALLIMGVAGQLAWRGRLGRRVPVAVSET